MISTHNLSVGYFPGATPILGEVNISVGQGHCTLLCGANGCGKTTLMRTICGTLKPLSGTIEGTGAVIMLPTGIPKVKGFTLGDMVRTMLLRESSWMGRLSLKAREAAAYSMDLLGLKGLQDRNLSTLSDGQFQRGCIAGGLCSLMLRREGENGGGTLILDEPTAFLDVEGKDRVLESLKEAAGELDAAILLSSHDIFTAIRHCDSIIGITPEGKTIQSEGAAWEDKIKTLQETFPALRLEFKE